MILKSAFIILIVTLLGRILGFIRGMFISEEFGLGLETDAYFAAFVIPMTLLMIIPGAIHSVFIPELKKMKEESDEAAVQLYQKVLTITLIVGFFCSVIGIILAQPIATLLAPGFGPEQKLLTAELIKWMIPSIFFIGFIGVVSAVLNVEKKFFIPSFGTVINSVVVIASIYFIVPYMGINGLALGTLLGIIGYAIIMIPELKKSGFKLGLKGAWKHDPNLKRMGIRFIPVILGSIISQLTIFAERVLASGLGAAKISALSFSYNLIQAPTALFAGAFVVPMFPLFSEYYTKNKIKELKALIEKGLSYLIVILVPIMAVFIAFNEEIIRLVYERGEFGASDTQVTSWALMFYSLSILAIGSRQLIIRVFYSIEDTKTPVIYGVISFLIYLILCPWLISLYDHGGIALSLALSGYIGTILLVWRLHKRIGNIFSKAILRTTSKVLAATIIMIFIARWDYLFHVPSFDSLMNGFPLYIGLPVILIICMIIYFICLILLKEPLIYELIKKIRGKLKI